jgi:hypothetical protein
LLAIKLCNNFQASIQYQTQQQQLLADAEEQKRRIETLEAAIAKEEKFRQAAEKIIAVSSDETQKRTKSELDECVRRLRLLRSELQALQCLSRNESPSDGRQNSPTSPSPNNDNNKRATSMIHIRASSYIPPSSPSYQTKSMTMLTNMPPSPGAIAQKASQQIHEHNGHMFINKQQDATATCYHCHDILFGLNQSVQCTQCRMVCHKFCHTSVSVTCQEYMELRHARKWYLMAADEADRSRWVHLLDNMKVYTIVDPDALRAAYPSTGH